MKKITYGVLVAMVVVVGYVIFSQYQKSNVVPQNSQQADDIHPVINNNGQNIPGVAEENREAVESVEKSILENQLPRYQFQADLTDVFSGPGYGRVEMGFSDGSFLLMGTFENLPSLNQDYFYEGWIIRDDPQSVVSTGVIQELETGVFINSFTSDSDYSDYDRYILTLEPNDSDPAPADHILEGEFRAL